MPVWTFYPPKNLLGLSPHALRQYRDECDGNLRRIQQEYAYLNGRRVEINKGFEFDGALAVGGVVVAGLGIAITAVFTFGGAIALAGGAISLMGAQRYSDRLIDRHLIGGDVQRRREAVAF